MVRSSAPPAITSPRTPIDAVAATVASPTVSNAVPAVNVITPALVTARSPTKPSRSVTLPPPAVSVSRFVPASAPKSIAPPATLVFIVTSLVSVVRLVPVDVTLAASMSPPSSAASPVITTTPSASPTPRPCA